MKSRCGGHQASGLRLVCVYACRREIIERTPLSHDDVKCLQLLRSSIAVIPAICRRHHNQGAAPNRWFLLSSLFINFLMRSK